MICLPFSGFFSVLKGNLTLFSGDSRRRLPPVFTLKWDYSDNTKQERTVEQTKQEIYFGSATGDLEKVCWKTRWILIVSQVIGRCKGWPLWRVFQGSPVSGRSRASQLNLCASISEATRLAWGAYLLELLAWFPAEICTERVKVSSKWTFEIRNIMELGVMGSIKFSTIKTRVPSGIIPNYPLQFITDLTPDPSGGGVNVRLPFEQHLLLLVVVLGYHKESGEIKKYDHQINMCYLKQERTKLKSIRANY